MCVKRRTMFQEHPKSTRDYVREDGYCKGASERVKERVKTQASYKMEGSVMQQFGVVVGFWSGSTN